MKKEAEEGDNSGCNMKLCQKFLLSKIESAEKDIEAKHSVCQAKFDSMEEATKLNAEIVTKRFESVNEFRSAMLDQAKSFATAKEVQMLSEDVRSLQMSRAELMGKASQASANVAIVISAVSLVLGIIGLILKF